METFSFMIPEATTNTLKCFVATLKFFEMLQKSFQKLKRIILKFTLPPPFFPSGCVCAIF